MSNKVKAKPDITSSIAHARFRPLASRRKALIVEDEVPVGTRIQERFEQFGFDAYWAQDLESAKAYVAEHLPDVFLADVHIQEETTVELAKRMRDDYPGTLVVGYSGVSGSIPVRRMMDISHIFIAKPIDPGDIVADVEAALGKRGGVIDEWLTRVFGGKIPDELNLESNIIAYEQSREQLRKQYPNEFVAFIDGQLVGHAPDRQALIDKIVREWRRTDVLVTKPSADDVIKLRRPRKFEA